jgi:hypothetical protein
LPILAAEIRFRLLQVILALIFAVWLPVAQITSGLDAGPGALIEESCETCTDAECEDLTLGSLDGDADGAPAGFVSVPGRDDIALCNVRSGRPAAFLHDRLHAFPPTGPPTA